MSDSFEFTLHSPLTKEDWYKIIDAEYENTMSVTFQTPQGKQVKYIRCEVLDKIRSEIKEHADRLKDSLYGDGMRHCIEIIDKYKVESEDKK